MIRFVLLALLCWPIPAFACGPDSDCTLGERSYRIRMPAGHDGTMPVGAIIHMHGYKGTAKGVMANKGLARMASELGLALIAAQTAGDDWVIPNAPRKREADGSFEFDYFDALIADVTNRFPVDTDRLVASGFSAGGMMVWNLACHRGDRFAAFAPFAGTFWGPVPESCPSAPAHLIHTHGTSDKVVPLDGRPIADTRQGAVADAIALFVREGAFDEPVENGTGAFACERRTNPDGRILELCLHPGGHAMRPQWLERAWRQFNAAGAL